MASSLCIIGVYRIYMHIFFSMDFFTYLFIFLFIYLSLSLSLSIYLSIYLSFFKTSRYYDLEKFPNCIHLPFSSVLLGTDHCDRKPCCDKSANERPQKGSNGDSLEPD